MQLFILVLIFCFIVFLYRLYHLANDDYILIKKNITLEQVFNAAFVTALGSLLFARLFYVLLDPQPVFLNPLGFLLFPYFPGLSLVGAIFGAALSLMIHSRSRRFPIGRVFDFFSLAFLSVLPIGLIGFFLLSQNITTGGIIKLVAYFVLSFGASLYLFPRAGSLEIKDGTISILFLIFVSLVSLLSNAVDHPGLSSFISHRENFVLIGFLLISIVILVKQELLGRISTANAR